MPMTSRSTPGRVRAAVDQVADEDRAAVRVAARRPPGRSSSRLIVVAELGQQGLELGAAAVDVADDVERPGLVAQVVEEPGARDRRGGDLVLAAQDVDGPEALPLQAAQGRAAARRAGGGSRGRRSRGRGGSRCARGRRSPARRARSRSAARRARGPARPARLRASGCTLVASTTVSRPAASRLPTMKCSSSNASAVADWSFSSSATRPRQKSDEITSVGLKSLARERRLARAADADQDDEAQLRHPELGHAVTGRSAAGVGRATAASLDAVGACRRPPSGSAARPPGRPRPTGRNRTR